MRISNSNPSSPSKYLLGTNRKSLIGGISATRLRMLSISHLNCMESLFPSLALRSRENGLLKLQGPIWLTLTIFPISCFTFVITNTSPPLISCRMQNISSFPNEIEYNRLKEKLVMESEWMLLKCVDSCIDGAVKLQPSIGHEHGANLQNLS